MIFVYSLLTTHYPLLYFLAMYLSKLEIHGFKSFATNVTLEFPRGLTAIVGPNGSGKSNVADAVRWVLGEQSLKALRGKKSEDVIFAGSTKKSRLGMAEVSMWLDNADHRAPIDFSEIVLTRRVYRSGEGEYSINKKPVRLQDILLLLAQANFGQKTYSVIGQGMVESFLTSTPEQRKELFEDAAGVRQYQMKREQSLHKLDQTRENLSRVELLLQEIEPRLRSLTRQVKRLERRSDVEAELRKLQVSQYANLLIANASERQGIIRQRDELQTTWNAADKRRKAIQKELDGLEGERSRADAFQALQKRYTGKIDVKNRLLEEQAVLKGRLELLAAQQGKFDVVLFSRANREVLSRLEHLEREATSLAEQLEKVTRRIGELEESKSEKFTAFHAALGAATIDGPGLRQLLHDLDSLWSQHVRFASDHARLSVRQEATSEERKRLEEEGERIAREEKGKAAKDPGAAYTELMAQHEVLDGKIRALDGELAELRDQLNHFNTTEQEKKERLFVLQKAFRDEQQTLNVLASRVNEFQVSLAKIDTRREDVDREMTEELPETTRQEIAHAVERGQMDTNLSSEQRQEEIHKLKKSLELIGGIDEGTQQEYEQTKERHGFLRGQYDDLQSAMANLEQVIVELDATIKKQFDTSFDRINEEFARYFRTLFNGGQAKLILQRDVVPEEPEDEEEEDDQKDEEKQEVRRKIGMPARVVSGIEIQAQPPNKKVKSITMLSGGERAMTAIALISAIIASNPSPFVVLDEVDAALDEANSARFAKIVAHLAEKTQFVTITHNRTTMEHSQVLYGVTMGDDGISKLLSIKMEEAEKVIKQYGNRG